MTLYWQNVAGDGAWNNVLNWFVGPNVMVVGTNPPDSPAVGDIWVDLDNSNAVTMWDGSAWSPGGQATSVPWTQDDAYKDYDLSISANPGGWPTVTGVSIGGGGWSITGVCDISGSDYYLGDCVSFLSANIYDGTFTGCAYFAQSNVYGGTFLGYVLNDYYWYQDSYITGGTFNGPVDTNSRIQGGTFNGTVQFLYPPACATDGIFNGTVYFFSTANIYGGTYTGTVYCYTQGLEGGTYTGTQILGEGIVPHAPFSGLFAGLFWVPAPDAEMWSADILLTGWDSESSTYYVAGVATTLDSSGTGIFNNRIYASGTPIGIPYQTTTADSFVVSGNTIFLTFSGVTLSAVVPQLDILGAGLL